MSDKPTGTPTTSSEKPRSLFEEIFDTIREPLLVLDKNLRVQRASVPFYDHFRVTPEETLGRFIYELGNKQWDIQELRTLLEDVLPMNEAFNGFEIRHEFEENGRRTMLLNARRIDHLQLILLAIEDITGRKQSEKELGESEKLYRTLAQSLPDGAIFILDRDLRYLLAGGQALESADFNPADFEGKTIWETLDTVTVKKYEPLFRQVLAGETFRYEYIHHRKYYLSQGVPIRDAEGAVTRILITSYDITERKNAEDAARLAEASAHEALREIEDLYRNAPVGLCALDHELRYVRVNARLAEINGIPAEEHIGKTVRELLPQLADSVEKDMCRVIETGEPRLDIEVLGETPAKPGVKRSWLEQLLPIFGEDGRVTGINIVAEETTARKETERALRESEQRLRIALDSAYLISFEWDIQNNEVRRFVSHEPALQSTLDEKPETFEEILEVVHPEDRELFKNNVEAALGREDGEYENEFRLMRSDGEVVWIYERGRVERDASGHPIRLIGLSQDITQRKKAEADLLEAKATADKANQAKSEFLAKMSHEIRTPMTVFLAVLEHLQQIDRNPEHRKLLEMADHSARHLRHLIDDILDLSRIEARQADLHEEAFDLRTWLEEEMQMFILPVREKNLRLETEVAEDVPSVVVADPNRLSQVLVNLVGNAVKFTEKGEVRVAVIFEKDHLVFTVADTGIGVAEENQHLLFKSFSQVETSRHRKSGGSGLGLAISKGLIELMGGRISMQSVEGQGSVFTFILTLKKSEEQENLAIKALATSIKVGFLTRILLVDDDPWLREIIGLNLRGKVGSFEEARSGEEAVIKWRNDKFDVILMDMAMPGIGGLEATRRIRQQEKETADRVCIIGYTAFAERKVIDDCLEAGMDRVLTKPVQMKILIAAMEECLAERQDADR